MIESTLRAGLIEQPSFALHLGSSSPVHIPPSLILGMKSTQAIAPWGLYC